MASRRDQLEELRDLLRDQLDQAPPSAVAGIAREYRATLDALAALESGATPREEEGSKVDELSARRAARRRAETAD